MKNKTPRTVTKPRRSAHPSQPPPAAPGSPTTAKKITVLLADDHVIVRQSLCKLLEVDPRFKVVGQARDGREAVKLARTLCPDVILMDIAMPLLNGLEATRQILAANPAARVLILSAYSDDPYIERMHAVGAVGYVEKQTSAEILAEAVCEIARGNKFYSPSIAKRMANGSHWSRGTDGVNRPDGVSLTSRETEVVQLVAEGHANKQIAAILGIGIKTVEKHRKQAMEKLSLHETADLTRYAVAQGIIENNVRLTIL